jgi:hypothetical protein
MSTADDASAARTANTAGQPTGNLFTLLAEHSRDFATFTMEILSDVKVGMTDTVDGVVEVLSDSRERVCLNETVDNIVKLHIEYIARFDDVNEAQYPEEAYQKIYEK